GVSLAQLQAFVTTHPPCPPHGHGGGAEFNAPRSDRGAASTPHLPGSLPDHPCTPDRGARGPSGGARRCARRTRPDRRPGCATAVHAACTIATVGFIPCSTHAKSDVRAATCSAIVKPQWPPAGV